MELCWSEWDFAFTPICQLISISRTKSDELLLMARKAVGCLVTFWLNASHALTIDRSISLARFFLVPLMLMLWRVCSRAHWLSFTAFSSCINQTACRFIITKTVESKNSHKKNQEMKISFIFEWNEKDQKEREREKSEQIYFYVWIFKCSFCEEEWRLCRQPLEMWPLLCLFMFSISWMAWYLKFQLNASRQYLDNPYFSINTFCQMPSFFTIPYRFYIIKNNIDFICSCLELHPT